MITLTKPLNTIDIESTGLDPVLDRIITLGIVQLHTDGETMVPFHWMFNPGKEITPENEAIHGISPEQVKDCPPFYKHAQEILAVLKGCDLCGFNILGFDIQILWEELYRCGIELDLSDTKIVDSSVIYKKQEPRDLTAALKFYCDEEHEGAHGAMADAKAALKVFRRQIELDRYQNSLPRELGALADYCATDRDGSKKVDFAGVIVRDKDGVYRYTHKKVRGVAVADDLGYLDWMLRSGFSEQTKKILRSLRDEIFQSDVGQGQGALF